MKLNYFDETDRHPRNQAVQHTVAPQKHLNTSTTDAFKVIQHVQYLAGGYSSINRQKLKTVKAAKPTLQYRLGNPPVGYNFRRVSRPYFYSTVYMVFGH